ncbi:MAG: hypothetical protein ACKO96_14880, partial [Flammeovirgaceae bacterium]
GWSWDQLPLTIKEGCTTYIASAPASGKTEWWFEVLINLSCLHGWKHVVFSPETGDAKDIFSELCHKYIGKQYIKGETAMTESERVTAELFIDEHFFVVDPVDNDLTMVGFYELVDQIEKQYNIRINTTTIDPWNELTEKFEPTDLGREDKYLSRILGVCRKNARKTNRHNCILNHVRDQAPITSEGVTYYPMPTARDFAGGQVWFRKGLTVIIPWRPPFGLCDKNGIPYEKNELHLRIAKSKPKGTSLVGVYQMYLDTEKYQYYIKDISGSEIYADRGMHTSEQFKPKQQPIPQIQFNGFKHSNFEQELNKSSYQPDPECGF